MVAVQDLGAAVAKYRAAFGLAGAEDGSVAGVGGRLAWFPGSPVMLGGRGWMGAEQHLKQFGEAPCAFVLGSKEGTGPGFPRL